MLLKRIDEMLWTHKCSGDIYEWLYPTHYVTQLFDTPGFIPEELRPGEVRWLDFGHFICSNIKPLQCIEYCAGSVRNTIDKSDWIHSQGIFKSNWGVNKWSGTINKAMKAAGLVDKMGVEICTVWISCFQLGSIYFFIEVGLVPSLFESCCFGQKK